MVNLAEQENLSAITKRKSILISITIKKLVVVTIEGQAFEPLKERLNRSIWPLWWILSRKSKQVGLRENLILFLGANNLNFIPEKWSVLTPLTLLRLVLTGSPKIHHTDRDQEQNDVHRSMIAYSCLDLSAEVHSGANQEC